MTSLTRYSGAVLIPMTLGALVGLWVTNTAVQRLRAEADSRMAVSATDLILREMGAATGALLEPKRSNRPAPPAVEAALRGDTVLAGAAILMSLDRDYRQTATVSMRCQLSRAIILIGQVDRLGLVTDARAATGFDAARPRAGAVEEATRDEADLIEALGTLGPPPPRFTSSGVLTTESGNRFYSAARTPDGLDRT